MARRTGSVFLLGCHGLYVDIHARNRSYVHNQYLLFIPFMLIGAAWAAMLAMPFTFVTNALQGYGHMGAYLGLFNGTICVPQIVAALVGGVLLTRVGSVQSHMMVVAGVCFVLGGLAVTLIKNK